LLHDPTVWVGAALPWWAAQRDTLSLLAAQARADSLLAQAATPVRRRQWTYRAAATRAYLALGRRSPDALTRFLELPDSLCFSCSIDRYAKATLLDSLGRHEDAERLLSERPYAVLGTLEVRAALKLATIAERAQHYATAWESYALVARAWSVGDPPQRALAAQSATKADQLGGDQPRPASLARSDRQ
jgi:serine/threonine-protein kinase